MRVGKHAELLDELLGRIACTGAKMRPVVTGVAWSAWLTCVCLLIATASHTKTTEPIKLPFGGMDSDVTNKGEGAIFEGASFGRL